VPSKVGHEVFEPIQIRRQSWNLAKGIPASRVTDLAARNPPPPLRCPKNNIRGGLGPMLVLNVSRADQKPVPTCPGGRSEHFGTCFGPLRSTFDRFKIPLQSKYGKRSWKKRTRLGSGPSQKLQLAQGRASLAQGYAQASFELGFAPAVFKDAF
jgi:hypothetical protein